MWHRGSTVIVHRPKGKDLRHGDAASEEPHPIENVAIDWSGTSDSHDESGTAVISDVVIYCPPGADIRSGDRVELPDKDRYRVVGKPARWKSPFTGRTPGVVVKLKAVQGR